MNVQAMTMVVLPEREWIQLKETQQAILKAIQEIGVKGPGGVPVRHITAKEFMAAVRIGRTKFDQLVNTSRIRVIKKRRKIYVPVGEVERYFSDGGIL
jgi:hypothetical protein